MAQRREYDMHLFVFHCNWITSDNPCEPIEEYGPGGYHPVVLEQRISSPTSEWRVVHKLGDGGHATVWLVQNTATFGWAALRISRADYSSPGEADVLALLTSGITLSHAVASIERFFIQGPNGVHSAIITEVVSPIQRTLTRLSHDATGLKRLVRDIVEGVVEMHAHGIVHCDLHIGNIGLAMPELSQTQHMCEDSRLASLLDDPAITIVMPRDPKFDLSHHPPYVVESCDMGLFHDNWRSKSTPDAVKFMDFGNAHLESKPCATDSIMEDICPPELALLFISHKDWQAHATSLTSARDIWALGIDILLMMSNEQHLSYDICSWKDHLRNMIELAGIIPSYWPDVHPDVASPELQDAANRVEDVWAKYRARVRPRCASDADADNLIAMLRRILVLDPASRPSAAQVLQDPWFALP